MSDTIRALVGPEAAEAIAVLNKHRLDLLKLKAGLIFHAHTTAAVATADAADLPTCQTLANALKAQYNIHLASACDATTGLGAHISADGANVVATAAATDLTTTEALANALKAAYNLHRALAANHATADATNTVTAAAATDLATSITLLNAIKVAFNAHQAAGFNSQAVVLAAP